MDLTIFNPLSPSSPIGPVFDGAEIWTEGSDARNICGAAQNTVSATDGGGAGEVFVFIIAGFVIWMALDRVFKSEGNDQ